MSRNPPNLLCTLLIPEPCNLCFTQFWPLHHVYCLLVTSACCALLIPDPCTLSISIPHQYTPCVQYILDPEQNRLSFNHTLLSFSYYYHDLVTPTHSIQRTWSISLWMYACICYSLSPGLCIEVLLTSWALYFDFYSFLTPSPCTLLTLVPWTLAVSSTDLYTPHTCYILLIQIIIGSYF